MNSSDGLRIAFIGGGAMAEAFVRGILAKGIAEPASLVVSDPLPARRDFLAAETGVNVTPSNLEAVANAGVLILAVKPQALRQVLDGLEGHVATHVLVLSIVTGGGLETICTALRTPAVVRIMPNTPGQVGEGISVWTTTSETSQDQREQASRIIGALGQEIHVADEADLDKATALSGSGPAYVFMFIEALIDAGVRIGFSRGVAEKLTLQTVRGSAIFAQQSGLHPAILRNQVTSPAGTTAEALQAFEEGGLRAVIVRGVTAAYHRAQELGDPNRR